jgi:hypothetical protein
MGSRSVISYLEEALLPPEPKSTPLVVNQRLSPILVKYAKKDSGLAQNINSTLATLERDAITRARLRLNKS